MKVDSYDCFALCWWLRCLLLFCILVDVRTQVYLGMEEHYECQSWHTVSQNITFVPNGKAHLRSHDVQKGHWEAYNTSASGNVDLWLVYYIILFQKSWKQTLNYLCILKEKTVILIFEHFVVHKVGHIFGGPSIFGAAETQDVEQFLYTSQWFEPWLFLGHDTARFWTPNWSQCLFHQCVI